MKEFTAHLDQGFDYISGKIERIIWTDVIEEDIDAVGCRFLQSILQRDLLVVEDMIEFQVFLQPLAFIVGTGETNDSQALKEENQTNIPKGRTRLLSI